MIDLREFQPREWTTLPNGQRYCCPSKPGEDHAITCCRRATLYDARGSEIESKFGGAIVTPTKEEVKQINEAQPGPYREYTPPPVERKIGRARFESPYPSINRRPQIVRHSDALFRVRLYGDHRCEVEQYGQWMQYGRAHPGSHFQIEAFMIEPIEGWKLSFEDGSAAVRERFGQRLRWETPGFVKEIAALALLMDYGLWLQWFKMRVPIAVLYGEIFQFDSVTKTDPPLMLYVGGRATREIYSG